jgi:putative DNA methylase
MWLRGTTGILDHYKGKKGRLGRKLIAVVAESKKGRLYLECNEEHEKLANSIAAPESFPTGEIDHWSGCTNSVVYGMDRFEKLFTSRQLVALTTFSSIIQSVKDDVFKQALKNGFADDNIPLNEDGSGAKAYSEAIVSYLALCLSRVADWNNSLSRWEKKAQVPQQLFGRHAIPMVWDYAEANPIGDSTGSFSASLKNVCRSLSKLPQFNTNSIGIVRQHDAGENFDFVNRAVISTDPPYYDNIPYSNLADFFYIWLRPLLKDIFPEQFSTLLTPKSTELVANQFRHGGKGAADSFFMIGMTKALKNMLKCSHPAYPITIYYAFKQSETKGDGTSSDGWEKFLEAIIESGLSITGTWPLRTESVSRLRGLNSNALASSILLVCRRRSSDMTPVTRRQFQRELREQMPEALKAIIGGETGTISIAPVDLAQAAIGPGMAIYSKYQAVLNQDGSKMSVHDALILINRAITDYLNPDSGNFDADTLFCDDWFSQYGWGEGQFGEANVLAQAKGTSVDGVQRAGVIESGRGKVRLLKWSEYPQDWDPNMDTRTPIWEACHQVIRVLNQQGESEAGSLLARMPERGEPIRQLAYHLYTLCERKKWADDARAYNELIGSWHSIVTASHEVGHKGTQTELGLDFWAFPNRSG